ncbi:GSCOCG00000401001-RA-CDS [Cotesia congregata]|nr:GSCOCG00000401001-RA-CDS [Cotesia congregata]
MLHYHYHVYYYCHYHNHHRRRLLIQNRVSLTAIRLPLGHE